MISAVGCGCHSEPVCKTLRTLAVKAAGLSMSQHAIMAGMTIEFDYKAEGKDASEWRRIIPYGLVHGSLSYLIGKLTLPLPDVALG